MEGCEFNFIRAGQMCTHTHIYARGLEAATVAYAVDRHWRSCATRRCMDDGPAAQVLLVVQTEALTLWRKVAALASVPYAHAAGACSLCVWLQLASREASAARRQCDTLHGFIFTRLILCLA